MRVCVCVCVCVLRFFLSEAEEFVFLLITIFLSPLRSWSLNCLGRLSRDNYHSEEMMVMRVCGRREK